MMMMMVGSMPERILMSVSREGGKRRYMYEVPITNTNPDRLKASSNAISLQLS